MGNVFSMYRMYSLYELARTRARENEALFGSREERAGEAGLSLLALPTLILVFSGKLDSQVFGSAGGTPPKEIKVRAGSSQRVSERGWMFALFTCVISLSQTGWRAWMFF